MKILILITTFNRPDDLLILLKELKKDKLFKKLHLIVFDDGSTKNYSKVINYLKKYYRFDLFRNEENRGKENYWQIVNAAYNEVSNHEFDYFLMIPDDIRLTDNFLTRCIQSYDAIEDNKKACLNIWNDYSRFGKSSWTTVMTKEVEFRGEKFHKIGWVDMCFICGKEFFEIINYSIHQVENRYLLNKNLSSGVGAQLSNAMINAGASIYQVIKSYVIHNDHQSVMHTEHRVKTPLITNHEWVIASMASIPSRVNSLKEVVNSIINQVDQLDIYLNDYDDMPDFLNHEKINCYLDFEHYGDLGDAGKFYKADKIKGYHFTIDDDIIYPRDYVKKMVEAIERTQRKYICTFHGRKFIKKPVKSYYHDAEVKISCLKNWDKDIIIDIAGTGVMAYHTDTIKFSIKDFEAKNMADVWAAKKAREKEVKILALNHKPNWIKHSKSLNLADTIYINCNGKDKLQTEVINGFL